MRMRALVQVALAALRYPTAGRTQGQQRQRVAHMHALTAGRTAQDFEPQAKSSRVLVSASRAGVSRLPPSLPGRPWRSTASRAHGAHIIMNRNESLDRGLLAFS